MKEIFDTVSASCSKTTTRAYSSSFSLGIYFLSRKLHRPIYGIYGFVRLADEIVDSFHDFDKKCLLEKFRADTQEAIASRISINPILNSFQEAVHQYNIEWELIDTFLKSMEMDLHQSQYTREHYQEYILGSAEVVGLMCLRVFTERNIDQYEELKPYAMKLGSAFQKVNFLRDVSADYHVLGRTYFPNVNFETFSLKQKEQIQEEIEAEFNEALIGIRKLPLSARRGVYVAYVYYRKLFNRIKKLPAENVMNTRVRIDNMNKIGLMFGSLVKHQLNSL
jgi:phytoene/squalene synthetase